MYKRSELSECELVTMKCVWDAKEPVTCQEVITELKTVYGLEYKDTTVYTFLKILKQKGFIDSYRKGITFYQPIRDEVEYREGVLRKMLDFWFKNSTGDMLAAISQMSEFTKEERETLEKLAAKAK